MWVHGSSIAGKGKFLLKGKRNPAAASVLRAPAHQKTVIAAVAEIRYAYILLSRAIALNELTVPN